MNSGKKRGTGVTSCVSSGMHTLEADVQEVGMVRQDIATFEQSASVEQFLGCGMEGETMAWATNPSRRCACVVAVAQYRTPFAAYMQCASAGCLA